MTQLAGETMQAVGEAAKLPRTGMPITDMSSAAMRATGLDERLRSAGDRVFQRGQDIAETAKNEAVIGGEAPVAFMETMGRVGIPAEAAGGALLRGARSVTRVGDDLARGVSGAFSEGLGATPREIRQDPVVLQ